MKTKSMIRIESKTQLLEAIKHIHFDCYKLCNQVFGTYFSNAGNIGVFSHTDEEYKYLSKLQEELTEPSDNPHQKYFHLKQSILVPAENNVPEATYTHLYIRKPDPTPYGNYLGDVDFFLEPATYTKLKNQILSGTVIKSAQIYDRPGWDMIQLSDPTIASVGYISTQAMAEKIRLKQL